MSIDSFIVCGRYAEAVKQLGIKSVQRIKHHSSTRAVEESIVAHMCLGKFAEAQAMSEELIAKFPRIVTWYYMHGGMIPWFQGRRKEAVAVWQAGITCGYTFYKAMDCPLLLWYAAMRGKGLIEFDVPLERMRNQFYKERRRFDFVNNVVNFILDEIDEAEARRLAEIAPWTSRAATQRAQVDFYLAMKHYARGNRRAFKRCMQACAEAPEIDMAIPELLLARFEMGMYPFQYADGQYKRQGHPDKIVSARRLAEPPQI